MSRIGHRILEIPENVNIELKTNKITVKGPKGELSYDIPKNIIVKEGKEGITVENKGKGIRTKKLHGTVNSYIDNMINGVVNGYEKNLEIVGVGYRFQLQGNKLVVNAGYSHPVEFTIPSDLEVTADSDTAITIKGIDKQIVGEFAAKVRKIREPEPYKGKGIRYKDERIRRKEGKKAAKEL